MIVARRLVHLPAVSSNVLAASVLTGEVLRLRVLAPLILVSSCLYIGASATLVGRGALEPLASRVGETADVDDRAERPFALAPSLVLSGHVLVYLVTSLVVARALSSAVLLGSAALLAFLVGASRADGRMSFPLLLVLIPLGATLGLVRDPVGIVAWMGFLTWTIVNIGRRDSLLAGIALIDAMFIAHAGHTHLAMFGAITFALTIALQRWTRGDLG